MDAKVAIDQINAIFGRHPRTRALHAKGDFFSGTFAANAWARQRTAAAPFGGEPVPALVRWSNGGGHPRGRDDSPDVRGMAVSLRHPDGAIDLVAQTAPRFPVRTPEAFMAMSRALAKPILLPAFLATHPSALAPLIANARAKAPVPPASYALATYYPIHAYKWVAPDGAEIWVRYRLSPAGSTAPEGDFGGRDRLREEMHARVAAGPVRFSLDVQVAGPGDDPHDPTSVWQTSWQRAGELTVTAHEENAETDTTIVVFDPTRVVAGIELSDDPILRFRAEAYDESARRRMGQGGPGRR